MAQPSLKLTKPPAELRAAFLALRDRLDVAALLDVPDKTLVYLLFRKTKDIRYRQFTLTMKSGGTRGTNRLTRPGTLSRSSSRN